MSFNNVQDADAIDRMTKGILGEHEGLKALGIAINETNLQAKMSQMGLKGQFASLDEVTKAQVRWQVMLDQTKNAQGDAVRSANSYESSVKRLRASIDETVQSFGAELIPIATQIVQAIIPVVKSMTPLLQLFGGALASGITSVVSAFSSLGSAVQSVQQFFNSYKLECIAIGSALGVLALSIGAYVVAQNLALITTGLGVGMLTAWEAVCTVATAVTGALTVAMEFLNSSFGLIAIGLIAVIGVGYLLIKNWDTVSAFAQSVWSSITSTISNAVETCKTVVSNVITSISAFITNSIESTKTAINSGLASISTFISGCIEGIKNAVSTGFAFISEAVSSGLNFIKNLVIFALKFMYMGVDLYLALVESVWGVIWQLIGDKVMYAFNLIKSYVVEGVTFIYNAVSTYLTTVYNFWSNIFTSIYNVVSNIFSSIYTFISSKLSEAYNYIVTTLTNTYTYWSNIFNQIATITSQLFTSIYTAISQKLSLVYQYISNKMNSVKEYWSNVLTSLQNSAVTIFTSIQNSISQKLNALKSSISSIWSSISSYMSNTLTSIKTRTINAFTSLKQSVVDKTNQIKNSITSQFARVKDAMARPVEEAKSRISGAFERIKSIFSTTLKPNIKMPHITMSGKFSLNPPSVPSFGVDWYQTGGIFTGASIIGIGENGDEAVLPLSNKRRMRPFADAVSSMILPNMNRASNGNGGDVNINVASLVVREEADIKRIAKELKTLHDRENRKNGIR